MTAWKTLSSSVRGTSHYSSGQPCQDNSHLTETVDVDGQRVIIVACSDGAGSAALAEFGSKVACETVVSAITEDLASRRFQDIDDAAFLRWYATARQALERKAVEQGAVVRDLAATLLVAVVGESGARFAQLGDGAMVLREETGGFIPAIWPPEGEYANITSFLSDGAWESEILFASHLGRVIDLAAFSDGLQRLALHQATKTVHEPFFLPLFRRLSAAEYPDELRVDLEKFLDSPGLNARTDDDKTLILATRRAGNGATL